MIVAVSVACVLLTAAGIVSMAHVVRSASVPDRAVGLDLLTSVIINTLAVLTAWSYQPPVVTLVILLTVFAFLGSVAVARFVERTRR
ncbi:MAG: monovalent cation/H+ antiporter complex subunit F [Actinomycetes bacterium]